IRVTKGGFDKLTHRVAFAGSKDEVVSFPCLQNSPHAFDILRRVSPVTLCVEVAEEQFLLQTMLNRGNRPRDLAGNESFPASRAFMVEPDDVARAKTVSLEIVNCGPIRKNFGHTVQSYRSKNCWLGFRHMMCLINY